MKPSELPGTPNLYRLTNRALAQIKELWQYAGEDELPPESLLQAQIEALRILHIEVPLSAKHRSRSALQPQNALPAQFLCRFWYLCRNLTMVRMAPGS